METLDKMYLELSQITKAITKREKEAATKADLIMGIVVHGAGTEAEKGQRIYDLAREIYEANSRETHYWHKN